MDLPWSIWAMMEKFLIRSIQISLKNCTDVVLQTFGIMRFPVAEGSFGTYVIWFQLSRLNHFTT